MSGSGDTFDAALQAGVEALLKAFRESGFDQMPEGGGDWRARLDRRVASAMRDLFPEGRSSIISVLSNDVVLRMATLKATRSKKRNADTGASQRRRQA